MSGYLEPERIEAEHKRDVEKIKIMPRKELNAEAAHRFVECMQLQNELETLRAENEALKKAF